MHITLDVSWWALPALLVVAGVLVGRWRAAKYRTGGMFDLSDAVFLFWFCVFAAAAIGMVGARVLFR